jgi:DNA-binding response OmpR family regulator
MDFRNASVLLFDPVGPNLLATRSILKQLGFEDIEPVREYEALTRKVSERSYDLMIFEVGDAGGDVCGVVRRLRSGETGINPFATILLTSWERQAKDIHALMDAGSDDLLLRPFSPSALRDRVNAHVRKRKPFVVTGDYIGPDRRTDATRPSNAQTIEAPNTLKAVVEGDTATLRRLEAAITEANDSVDRERLKRLAIRISTSARLRLDNQAGSDNMSFADLHESSKELRRRLRGRNLDKPLEIATALCEIVARVCEDDHADNDQLTLMCDLPMAAYAALEGENAGESTRKEVDAVLNKIRARYRREPMAKAG